MMNSDPLKWKILRICKVQDHYTVSQFKGGRSKHYFFGDLS